MTPGDGKPVDFAHWPLADSRWLCQTISRQLLTVTDGTMGRAYDFTHWSIIESGSKP